MNPVPPRLLFIFHCSKKSDFLIPLIYIELLRMRATVFSGSPFETTEHSPPPSKPGGSSVSLRYTALFTRTDWRIRFTVVFLTIAQTKRFSVHIIHAPIPVQRAVSGTGGGGDGIVRERSFAGFVRTRVSILTRLATRCLHTGSRSDYDAFSKLLFGNGCDTTNALWMRGFTGGDRFTVLTAKTYTTKTEKWREDTARRRRRNTDHARRVHARRLVATTQFIRLCPTGECDGVRRRRRRRRQCSGVRRTSTRDDGAEQTRRSRAALGVS